MSKKVNRTLTMRTAFSHNDFGSNSGGHGSLESLLLSLHGNLPSVSDRRASFDEMVIEGRNIEETEQGCLLHIVAFTPDGAISIVPGAVGDQGGSLSLLSAPTDAEFLDGELMLLVRGNDVAVCRSGLGIMAFNAYVDKLAEMCDQNQPENTFVLQKRADVNKVALVTKEGVKSLSMGSIANKASVDRAQRETIQQSIVGSAIDEFLNTLGREEDIPQEAENLKVEVLITFDKRNGTSIGQQQLQAVAEQVLAEDDEGFMIETMNGKKIRAKDLLLSKPVRLPAFGKSVNYEDAWCELVTFHNELTQAQ
jgi:hypothetical protein